MFGHTDSVRDSRILHNIELAQQTYGLRTHTIAVDVCCRVRDYCKPVMHSSLGPIAAQDKVFYWGNRKSFTATGEGATPEALTYALTIRQERRWIASSARAPSYVDRDRWG